MQAVAVRVFQGEAEEPFRETATDAGGRFSLALPPGTYRVEVFAPAFVPFTRSVTVGPGTKPLAIVLEIDLIDLAVEVIPDETLIADTTTSLTSLTLAGEDLLDLPRTEEDLAEYLMLLAGADVTGDLEEDILANFIIDGFEDGRLPRPDQIAQIIIDPASLRAGSDGRPRIEIVTRPGTGEWRGSVDLGFADESLNARTPGETRKEPRQTRDVGLDVRGPVIPGVLEVTFEVSSRTDERAGQSLRAITPNAELSSGVVRPQTGREVEIGARLQLNARHRLDVDFARDIDNSSNQGVGGFQLPERGSDQIGRNWTFRVSERMFGSNMANNVRFEVSRRTSERTPLRQGFAIDVADAFSGGGSTSWSSSDNLTVRLDESLRLSRGNWSVEWGGQLRYTKRESVDRDNYNGTFEFSSLHDYCMATGFAGINCAATQQIVAGALAQGVEPMYFDARGREIPISGVPTTFTQASGNAELEFNEFSFSTHIQADRRFGQRASFGLGLAYSGTSHSRDFLRFNPTASLQYRLTESTVVSGGARLSFQDFGDTERLLRNDGSSYETELFISSPSFPDPFQGGTIEVGEDTASLWVLHPDYRSPYTLSPQISVTQQVPGNVRLSLSYNASYGTHQRRTRNANAPAPGTPLPDEILDLPFAERQEVVDQMRPMYPFVGNVTQIESSGRSRSRQVRLQVQPRRSLDVFGLSFSGQMSYSYRTAHDDNDFTNPWAPEWGPSRRDHEVQSRFRLSLPDDVPFAQPFLRTLARATYADTDFNVNVRANTGRLYSIQSGRDLNGDQSTRDRPVGVARNTEVGPGSWNLDMTFTKNVELFDRDGDSGRDDGREGGGRGQGNAQGRGDAGRGDFQGGGGGGWRGFGSNGPRVRFQARVNNLLNRTQPRAYGSVLTSPFFGIPTGYTGGRTVSLSMSVDF
jgi:hypothetical protein